MEIEAGSPERCGEAAALLARAFDQDPGARLLYPGPRRGAILERRFLHLLEQRKLGWHAGTSPDGRLEACAVWSGLPGIAPPAGRRVRHRPGASGEIRASLRMALAAPALALLAARCRPRRSWTLVAMGVEPGLTGTGRGGTMLRRLLGEADAAGLRGYLETVAPRNLRFYRRWGFRIAGAVQPLGGPRTYAMVRPTAPAPAAEAAPAPGVQRSLTS